MKKNALLMLMPLLFVLLAACDSNSPGEAEEQLVVEAFLYVGEPVADLRVSTAASLVGEDTLSHPINEAQVVLYQNGTAYRLTPKGADGYYYDASGNLAVTTDDQFRLEVTYNSTFITAETTVPQRPVQVGITDTQLQVRSFGGGPGGGPGGGFGSRNLQDDVVSVTWDNASEGLHYVVIESLENENPDFILPEFIRERFGGFRFVTEPTTANYHDINLRALEVTGLHQAVVYRINQEYADLYENREQDSRDLNEPPSNIQGGLGVFSAFSSDTVLFDVVREE